MKKRGRIVALIVVVIAAIAVAVFLTRGGGGTEVTGDLKVPLNLEKASNIGSIDIELTYDPSVLEVVDVKAGEIASNAMMEYNAETPGRVIIGLIDSSGISGDGTLVMFGFNVLAESETTSLALESVKTHDASTLIDVINETVDGSFTATGRVISPPIVRFAD